MGCVEDSRPKKVPYNPNYDDLQARASVKIPKWWGTLADALLTLESGHYSGLGFMLTPPLVMIDLDHSLTEQHKQSPTRKQQRLYNRSIPIRNFPQAAQDCIFSPMDSYQEKGYTPQLRCMDKTALPPSPHTISQEHHQR